MKTRKIRRVAIYARLSLSTDESVSIKRQVEAAEHYAKARGWEVVLVSADDGVSASRVRPENRTGWKRILKSSTAYDAVIVWKTDRLARSVLDFLNADRDLQKRGAALVAVDDPVDMTTPQGRAFATILAVFAEMEAEAISARVAASRPVLLREGRRPGIRPPYGWMHAPDPSGKGKIVVKDPDRIEHVIAAADMILAGKTLSDVARYLSEEATPRRARKNRISEHWAHHRVEDLLRNPTLAGMVPYNPGRLPGETPAEARKRQREERGETALPDDRGTEVLRGEDGLPIVFDDVAIMSADAFRLLQARLDARKVGKRPRIGKVQSLLSGVLICSGCDRALHRRGDSYGCAYRECGARVAINLERAEAAVASHFLDVVGSLPVVDRVEVRPEQGPRVGDLEEAIQRATEALGHATTEEEEDEHLQQVRSLKARLREARAATADEEPRVLDFATDGTFAEVWESLKTPNERRDLLGLALERITLLPPIGRGRNAAPAEKRLVYTWREPSDERLARDYGEGTSRGPKAHRERDALPVVE